MGMGFERWAGMVKGLGGREKRRAQVAILSARLTAGLGRWARRALEASATRRLHQIGQILAAVLLMEACREWLGRRRSACMLLERWRHGMGRSRLGLGMDHMRWEHAEREFELLERLAQWEKLDLDRRGKGLGTGSRNPNNGIPGGEGSHGHHQGHHREHRRELLDDMFASVYSQRRGGESSVSSRGQNGATEPASSGALLNSFKSGRASHPQEDLSLQQTVEYYERMVALAMETRRQASEYSSPPRQRGGDNDPHQATGVAESMKEYYDARLVEARQELKNASFHDVARRRAMAVTAGELPSTSVYT